jgi:hypothetical protein
MAMLEVPGSDNQGATNKFHHELAAFIDPDANKVSLWNRLHLLGSPFAARVIELITQDIPLLSDEGTSDIKRIEVFLQQFEISRNRGEKLSDRIYNVFNDLRTQIYKGFDVDNNLDYLIKLKTMLQNFDFEGESSIEIIREMTKLKTEMVNLITVYLGAFEAGQSYERRKSK